MSVSTTISKKEQFVTTRRCWLPHFAGTFALVVICGLLIFVGFYLANRNASSALELQVTSPRSYIGKVVPSQSVQPLIENGQARIRLADVEELNIVDFEIEKSGNTSVPVMAYITSSGRLFVGHSTCACGSLKYFLAGEALVCSSCRSTFTIEDQEFISGAASVGSEPPARIKYVIEDGMIVIDLSDL
jgi:hypothetical protein